MAKAAGWARNAYPANHLIKIAYQLRELNKTLNLACELKPQCSEHDYPTKY